jgi:hypothetical protein
MPNQSTALGAGKAQAYLLRDTFADTVNPVVDGATLPLPGLRDVTGALLKNLAGALRGGSQTSSPAWGSSKIVWTDASGAGFARVNGRTFCALITLEDFGSDMALGWDTATGTGDPRTVGHGWLNENGNAEAIAPGMTPKIDQSGRFIRSAQYLAGVTLFDQGAVTWITSFAADTGGGGMVDPYGVPICPSARVLWIDDDGTTTPLYPYISFLDSGNSSPTYPNGQCVQDARVVDVASWASADALASFVDRVTRADSATVPGGSWVVDSGTWGVSSNQLYIVTASGFTRAHVTGAIPSGGDGIVAVDITAPNPATVGFGFVVRWQDANNFIRVWNNGGNSIAIQTWVGGSFGATIASTAYTWTTGHVYRVFLIMKGNQYRIFIWDRTAGAFSDPFAGSWSTDSNNRFLTAQGIGTYSNNSAGNGTTRWDNFAVYPIAFALPAEILAGATPVVRALGATLAQDSFTDTNGVALTAHTAESGGAWTNILGTWTVQSNRASCAASVGSNMITQALGTANAECSVDIITPASFPTTTVRAGICVRYVDSSNYLFVRLYKDSGTSEIEINETVSGSGIVSHKVDLTAAGVAVATTYTLKIQIAPDPNGGDDLLHVLLDGKPRLSYKLRSANAGTRFGLYRENTDDGCVFDNWSAKAL